MGYREECDMNEQTAKNVHEQAEGATPSPVETSTQASGIPVAVGYLAARL